MIFFFFFPSLFSFGWMKHVRALSKQICVQLSLSRQLPFILIWFLLVAEQFAGSGREELWARSRNCPFSSWPGWDRDISWKIRTGWAVPRAPVQAAAILVFVNTLPSQFPACLCHLFMPAFYLYSQKCMQTQN